MCVIFSGLTLTVLKQTTRDIHVQPCCTPQSKFHLGLYMGDTSSDFSDISDLLNLKDSDWSDFLKFSKKKKEKKIRIFRTARPRDVRPRLVPPSDETERPTSENMCGLKTTFNALFCDQSPLVSSGQSLMPYKSVHLTY